MSRTTRSEDRSEQDFKRTPEWVTQAVLPHLPLGGTILEPAAGDGAIVQVLLDEGVPHEKLYAVELDEERAQQCAALCPTVRADFLTWTPPRKRFDLILSNPPFSLMLPFAARCLEVARGASVALLGRLPWMEPESTGERRAFIERTRPRVCIIPRPSFDGQGTDMTAYAWFLWNCGAPGTWEYLDANKPQRRRG